MNPFLAFFLENRPKTGSLYFTLMKKNVKALLLALAVFSFAACQSSSKEAPQAEAGVEGAATVAADSTSAAGRQMAYMCPMECEGSASMQPGKCPVCGMDLVENPDYTPADSTITQ